MYAFKQQTTNSDSRHEDIINCCSLIDGFIAWSHFCTMSKKISVALDTEITWYLWSRPPYGIGAFITYYDTKR